MEPLVDNICGSLPREVKPYHSTPILCRPWKHRKKHVRVLPGTPQRKVTAGEDDATRARRQLTDRSYMSSSIFACHGAVEASEWEQRGLAPSSGRPGFDSRGSSSLFAPPHHNPTDITDTTSGNRTRETEIADSVESQDVQKDGGSVRIDYRDRGQLVPHPMLSQNMESDVKRLVRGDGTVGAVTDSDVNRTYSVLQKSRCGDGDTKYPTDTKLGEKHRAAQQLVSTATPIQDVAETKKWNLERNMVVVAAAVRRPLVQTCNMLTATHGGAPAVPTLTKMRATETAASVRAGAARAAPRVSVVVDLPTHPTAKTASFDTSQALELTEGLGGWAEEAVTVGQLLESNRLRVAEDLKGVTRGEKLVRKRLKRHVGEMVLTLPLSFLKRHGYLGDVHNRGLERAMKVFENQVTQLRANAWSR